MQVDNLSVRAHVMHFKTIMFLARRQHTLMELSVLCLHVMVTQSILALMEDVVKNRLEI